MPYKEREIQKQYYSMGEVSEIFGVNASLLRYYEKEFDILQPKKNNKGNRMFTPKDLENLQIIFQLIHEKGYTIKGAKDYLKNNQNTIREQQKLIQRLENIKSFLQELSEGL